MGHNTAKTQYMYLLQLAFPADSRVEFMLVQYTVGGQHLATSTTCS
jgi:hypothetical protein